MKKSLSPTWVQELHSILNRPTMEPLAHAPSRRISVVIAKFHPLPPSRTIHHTFSSEMFEPCSWLWKSWNWISWNSKVMSQATTEVNGATAPATVNHVHYVARILIHVHVWKYVCFVIYLHMPPLLAMVGFLETMGGDSSHSIMHIFHNKTVRWTIWTIGWYQQGFLDRLVRLLHPGTHTRSRYQFIQPGAILTHHSESVSVWPPSGHVSCCQETSSCMGL